MTLLLNNVIFINNGISLIMLKKKTFWGLKSTGFPLKTFLGHSIRQMTSLWTVLGGGGGGYINVL